ncbi:MAG: hypothetical protein ACSLEW_14945 [Nocardioides sp.]
MLLAHAVTLAQARSHLAALADTATSFEASVEYERVLLHLDDHYRDTLPALSPVPDQPPRVLFHIAAARIEGLHTHGLDLLSVELLLDMLHAAHSMDQS